MIAVRKMERRALARRLVLAAAAAWTLALVLLGLALRREAPGPPGQDVLGVGFGSYDGPGGIVYLSGRQLSCAPVAAVPFTSRCTVAIAGQTLELLARRNPAGDPNQLGGACEARYAGRVWPCQIGSRHVHVHAFAYLDQPLGLTPAQLEAVRRAHPLANLPEEPFLLGVLLVAAFSAMVAAGGATAWFVSGGHGRGKALAAAALAGPVAFATSFVLALRATSGFWD